MGNSSKRRKSLGLDRVYFELKFPHTSIVLLDAGKLLEQTEALDSISISTGYRLSGKYADLKQINMAMGKAEMGEEENNVARPVWSY